MLGNFGGKWGVVIWIGFDEGNNKYCEQEKDDTPLIDQT